MNINIETGEVTGGGASVDLVPLNLTGLDEDELLQMFPTPAQCTAALMSARAAIARAPDIMVARSKAVKDAKRVLAAARGYARARATGRDADTRKLTAESDPDVLTAWENLDIAELALEYARERRKSLSEDIEILRSMNADFRRERS